MKFVSAQSLNKAQSTKHKAASAPQFAPRVLPRMELKNRFGEFPKTKSSPKVINIYLQKCEDW